MSQFAQYAFRPDIRVIVVDPDSVEIRTGVWNVSSVSLSDEERKGKLAAIILDLWRGVPTEDLVRNHTITSEDLLGVIDHLAREGVLFRKDSTRSLDEMPYLTPPHLDASVDESQLPSKVFLVSPEPFEKFYCHILPVADQERFFPVEQVTVASLTRWRSLP